MADILPFRPWHYNRELSASLDSLVSPLFDVVSDDRRNELYKNPFNSIHLSVPQPPGAADRAARLLHEWKTNGLTNFSEEHILKKMEEDFIIESVDDMDTLPELIAGKPWAFGIMFREKAFKIELKRESFSKLKWPFPEEVKNLDLTVMHYFIIEKILGIPGMKQRESHYVDFDSSFSDGMEKVIRGVVQMATITNEVPIEDVKRICKSGYTLPQQSTYFYPKVISGFLFSSIAEAEFLNPYYSPF